MTTSPKQSDVTQADDVQEAIACKEFCPDNRHDEFEYGAYCIANMARAEASMNRSRMHPSKVRDELSKLNTALSRTMNIVKNLSVEADTKLNTEAGCPDFFDPRQGFRPVINKHVTFFQEIVERAIDAHVPGARAKQDTIRADLGRDAAAIWLDHGGCLDDDRFIDFVEMLVDEAGFDGAGKKTRASAAPLVEEVREYVKAHGAPVWSLW
jgi:hypothetical protein